MTVDHLVIFAMMAVVGVVAFALVKHGSPYLAVFIIAMLLSAVKVKT